MHEEDGDLSVFIIHLFLLSYFLIVVPTHPSLGYKRWVLGKVVK